MSLQVRILVAEDDKLASMALQIFLEGNGYRVSVASDGLAAEAAFDKDPADILLTDIRMPRMDGLTLINQRHARKPDLPVIIMTGNMTVDMFTVQPCNGPTTLFRKPITPPDLLKAIRASLPDRH
jgi:DNA-binding NtrC family response regulator